ncbi:MAG: hypothetical protein ACOX79_02470 [Methanosarcina sp.]|jgi:hypothetical protein
MRLPMKIICVFLIFALLTSCVAATENKNLPTKKEITDFIASIPVSDNYINTVFDTVKDKHPVWNCDIWVDKNGNQLLSLYYVDPGSAKGYGSVYFNELGKEIITRGVEIVPVPVKSYVGKTASVETIDNTVQIADETVQTGHETTQIVDKTVQTPYVTVQTANKAVKKDLPTKKEITDFIAGIPVSDNYINTVYYAVVDKHPAWNCDIWKDKNGNQLLSLYYADPRSEKGYDSIYFNELGREISLGGVEIVPVPVKSYVGKAASEEIIPVETMTNSIQEQPVGDERMAEYEERMAEYEERLAEYEEKQSVGYGQQIINTVQSIDGKDQSAEYEELLAEYKELLDVYKETQKIRDVTPPTKPKETGRGINILDGIIIAVIGGLILNRLDRNP